MYYDYLVLQYEYGTQVDRQVTGVLYTLTQGAESKHY